MKILPSERLLRLALTAIACVGTLIVDVSTAHAQSASCQQLAAALSDLDRSGGYASQSRARDLGRQVQAAESRYIRDGCNDDARAGRTLSQYCRGVAQDVLRLREEFARAQQSASAGGQVARQREAILQEMARFGCGRSGGSNANLSRDRQTLFDRIFGGGEYSDGSVVEGAEAWSYGGRQTLRTVCVRVSDGFFWPISYATTQDFVMEDAQRCEAMCPNTPVELYYYNNPGEEPEQMRNIAGQPYSALPNAFAYRDRFSEETRCNTGMQTAQQEQMPSTPTQTQPIEAASAETLMSDVPLPRPRPTVRGAEAVAEAVESPAQTGTVRQVQIGDRTVRVVGPQTPYARSAAEGT
ncbi:hypothetical protein GCM10007989_25590 [Devosia pacifica]|uniref:DUF2865 domain-containing protein n=1 Tax=Devosia pacifica TaxID=1335967 RepID=A0A918SAA5_9HYPH|nr:DUF2865 domain-containing protein [Devosia pacifica]GHA28934.1 hypothetical protein GCM10007989_25590 [Devosia pacifica]